MAHRSNPAATGDGSRVSFLADGVSARGPCCRRRRVGERQVKEAARTDRLPLPGISAVVDGIPARQNQTVINPNEEAPKKLFQVGGAA